MIQFLLLVNRQPRLARWYTTLTTKEKNRLMKDITTVVISRTPKMTNVIEHKEAKIIYRRYASLFFICGVDQEENELIALEVIHRYVELLDRYFGNVCELDIIYSFDKVSYVLDELIEAGEVVETSKKAALKAVSQQDALADSPDEEAAKEQQPVAGGVSRFTHYG
ncbi:AP complex, mu/sigma subunit [Hyaloraphidium curvatum]|nr:AP complex, mu/sigma subunit [Hyaloraphidium curvatum]